MQARNRDMHTSDPVHNGKAIANWPVTRGYKSQLRLA